jgi:hypothetical protein
LEKKGRKDGGDGGGEWKKGGLIKRRKDGRKEGFRKKKSKEGMQE